MHRFARSEIVVYAFTLAYMAIWPVVALVARNGEFLYYFVVMCLLIAAVGLVHWRVGLRIGARWGLSIWGLAHMAGGLMPIPDSWPRGPGRAVLYNLWLVPDRLKYDQLVHAFGFGLVTWICWQGLQRAFAGRGVDVRPTWGLLTLCVAAGM